MSLIPTPMVIPRTGAPQVRIHSQFPQLSSGVSSPTQSSAQIPTGISQNFLGIPPLSSASAVDCAHIFPHRPRKCLPSHRQHFECINSSSNCGIPHRIATLPRLEYLCQAFCKRGPLVSVFHQEPIRLISRSYWRSYAASYHLPVLTRSKIGFQ